MFVLTGGPCSGKSTTLRALQQRGFNIIDETAREIIGEELAKAEEKAKAAGGDPQAPEFQEGLMLPWNDMGAFQIAVLHRQIAKEESAVSAGLDSKTFLDRGLVDNIAYYRLADLVPPDSFVAKVKARNYKKVFMLDMLECFENDPVRKEDPETAHKIHRLLLEAYEELGFSVVRVPPASVEERVSLILENVEKN